MMEKTAGYHSHSREIPPEKLASVEGVAPKGEVEVRVMHVTDALLILEVKRKAGLVDPLHRHDDHESAGYLISGRMRVIIGDEEFIAEPGTSWIHPVGVDHYSEALEDCVQIEIKSPPRKTWEVRD